MSNNDYRIRENIVNIAMRAAELLKEGLIERDDISGHSGMTETIVRLAERFEREHEGVDYDAEGRDYWLEIDAFAEKELMQQYGLEDRPVQPDLNIKVIINEGIVEAVLKDQNAPVNVEVVDIDPDYEDFEQLDDYRKQLYADTSFQNCDHTVTHFYDEPEFTDVPDFPVKVYAVAGSVRKEVYSGTWDDCKDFCDARAWEFIDENEFQWNLEIDDEREAAFPEGFFDALDRFSQDVGTWIENEFVRQHAEELVYCYKNGLCITDFDSWTRIESLLDEKLTFQEASALASQYDGDPHEIPSDDLVIINEFRSFLNGYRAAEQQIRPSLDSMIHSAAKQAGQPQTDDKNKSQDKGPVR